MSVKRVTLLLILLAAVLTIGCLDDQAVKEMTALRKAGDADVARGMAISLLMADNDRMAIWCELAFSDEALSRDESLPRASQLRYLQEAGLICAAVCAHHDGQPPDDRWGAVTTLVTADINSRIAGTLGTVEMQNAEDEWVSEQAREEIENEFPERMRDIYPRRYEAWMQPNLQQVHDALRIYSRLKPLAVRLPPLSTQRPTTTIDAALELHKWADRRELSHSVVEGLYESGEVLMATAYAHAVEDLLDPGHLQASTILDSSLYRE